MGGRFVWFWAFEEQTSPKWEISCPCRPWTTVQNLTRLALSSPKKSVTVQTNKQKQTVTDISTPCLSACVDNKGKDHTVWRNQWTASDCRLYSTSYFVAKLCWNRRYSCCNFDWSRFPAESCMTSACQQWRSQRGSNPPIKNVKKLRRYNCRKDTTLKFVRVTSSSNDVIVDLWFRQLQYR